MHKILRGIILIISKGVKIMAISLEKIYLETKDKYKLSLVAGKSGMDKILSWVHYTEDSTTIDFIRGGELIITTGMGYTGKLWLEELIKRLIERGASGILINVGNYIKNIPEDILRLCEESSFSLLTMPWEIHLVDIMQDYANKIIHEQEKDINFSSGLLKAIIHPQNVEEYIYSLEEGGYNVNAELCVAVIKISQSEKEKIMSIITRLNKRCNVTSKPYEVILVFRNMSMPEVDEVIRAVLLHYGEAISVGVGGVVSGVRELSVSYKQAQYAIFSNDRGVSRYEDIGINKILLAIEDIAVLRSIFDKYLGKLLAQDNENGTQYMEVLRKYIDCNSSVSMVAEQTFTHRNTINYRIKKIKEIIGINIDDAENKFYLKLSFYIWDILKKKSNKN